MKIAIMGAGAVGAYYGGALARHGAKVVLIARGEHAGAMGAKGLRVESNWGDYVVHPEVALTPSAAGTVDVVLHCVKLYSNSNTIPEMRPLVGDGTVILTVQNGITGGESLAAEFGWERVLEGATYIETSITGPGHVVQTGSAARIEFGERDGSISDRVETVRDVLSVPGVQVEVSSDIRAFVMVEDGRRSVRSARLLRRRGRRCRKCWQWKKG